MLVEPSKLIDMIDELCFLHDYDALYGLQDSNSSPFYSYLIENKHGKSMFDTGAIHIQLLLEKNTEFRVHYHRLTPREDTTNTLTSIGEDIASANDLRHN